MIAGLKGLNLLRDLPESVEVLEVATYELLGSADVVEEIRRLSRERGATCLVGERPSITDFSGELIFAAGWQFLVGESSGRFVVLHDSLLPKYRGFSPTVAALINGETTIGVSAILPKNGIDDGPLIAQSSVDIEYPITIAVAFELLRNAYLSVFNEVHQVYSADRTWHPIEQDETKATFSVWRDKFDYAIDWQMDASKLCRFVHALSDPYEGAVTATFDGQLFRAIDAREVPAMPLIDAEPGKVIAINEEWATVVCGGGCIEILLRDADDSSVSRLRTRFAPVDVTRQVLAR